MGIMINHEIRIPIFHNQYDYVTYPGPRFFFFVATRCFFDQDITIGHFRLVKWPKLGNKKSTRRVYPGWFLHNPRDPITETENGFMEPKYYAFWRWLYTPSSSSDKVIGPRAMKLVQNLDYP